MPAEGAVFFLVDFLEQRALVEFDGFFQIVLQFFLGDVEQAQFEPGAGLGVLHQQVQAAPGGFEFLQVGVVQHFV